MALSSRVRAISVGPSRVQTVVASSSPAALGTNAERRLRKEQRRKRCARTRAFETQLRFSWLQCFGTVFSLVLVCTDVPRSGLGITGRLAALSTLEPDVFHFYGPWHYPLRSTSRELAEATPGRVWSYKFDTTSIGMRAFAEFYGLAAFPACILYRGPCAEPSFSGRVAFEMLDSLVDATASRVQRQSGHRRRTAEPVHVTLRSENTYLDRLHHYVLPQLFTNPIRRTNLIAHYPPDLLVNATEDQSRENARRVCFGFVSRPGFCQEHWANFAHSCPVKDASCKQVGRIWEHALNRVRGVQQLYPANRVDVTFLESYEDLKSCSSGICVSGVRKADVTAITRVRACGERGECRSVFIDEYRYETGSVYSNAMQWHHVVAILRVVGQSYYYVRIAMLLAFCFLTTADSKRESELTLRARVSRTCVLFLKVPMQTIVFGASFPILCYAVAHAIDSTVTYELLANMFTTQNGFFHLNLADMFYVGFNQMRSVWLFALVFHAAIDVRMFSRRNLSWRPIDGVRGVPEFFLGGLASATMFAHWRSTHFRDTRVRSVMEVVDTPRMLGIKYQSFTAYPRGGGFVSPAGVLIDVKFFICMMALLGVLWPIASMCVHWPKNYYCVDTLAVSKVHSSRISRALSILPPMAMKRGDFDAIRSQMKALHDRGDDVDATIAFMNLVALSDPIVYYRAIKGGCVGAGKLLGYYQSDRRPDRFFLLPCEIVVSTSRHTSDLALVYKVRPSALDFVDLIHCG